MYVFTWQQLKYVQCRSLDLNTRTNTRYKWKLSTVRKWNRNNETRLNTSCPGTAGSLFPAYGMHVRRIVVRISAGASALTLLRSVHASSWTQLDYSMGIGAYFTQGVKRLGRGSDHSPPQLQLRLRVTGAAPSFPYTPSWLAKWQFQSKRIILMLRM